MAFAISRLRLTSRLEIEVRKLRQLGKKHEELISEQKEQLSIERASQNHRGNEEKP
jgi:hypothetical protein